MGSLDPYWRKLLLNLIWYIVAILLVIGMVYLRLPVGRWLPWVVVIGGGIWLAWSLFYLERAEDQDEARLKSYLDQALAYKVQIDQALSATLRQKDRAHLSQLAIQVDNWTEAIQDLVQRLSDLHYNEIIRRDIKDVPAAIADLEARLAHETDAAIQAQLERALANRRKQLVSLEQLQSTMKRAEIQIESTLSLLGTIYSQILTGQSTSHVADYSRLSADIDEEVHLLQDQLEALREVKLGGNEP